MPPTRWLSRSYRTGYILPSLYYLVVSHSPFTDGRDGTLEPNAASHSGSWSCPSRLRDCYREPPIMCHGSTASSKCEHLISSLTSAWVPASCSFSGAAADLGTGTSEMRCVQALVHCASLILLSSPATATQKQSPASRSSTWTSICDTSDAMLSSPMTVTVTDIPAVTPALAGHRGVAICVRERIGKPTPELGIIHY